MSEKPVQTNPTFKESKDSGEVRVAAKDVSASNALNRTVERNNEVRKVK